MANYISEDDIEKRAIKLLLEELNYDEHINCYTVEKENLNDGSNRISKDEVVLKDRLLRALTKLNPKIPYQAIQQALNALLQGRTGMSLMLANKEIYELLKEGFLTRIQNSKGREEQVRVKYIDFKKPNNNEFLVVNQLWIKGMPKFRRPDLIIYINGIPLVLIELKNANFEVKNAYDDNLKNYIKEIPQLFTFNAICILSNGIETKVGAFNSEYTHFFEWLRIENEKEDIDRTEIKYNKISLDNTLQGLCSKKVLIDYLENFILFHTKGAYKIIAKNHQYLGVNRAIDRFKNREAQKGKLGVFWHTQRSGKSFSMIMYCQKIQRKFKGDFTFFIVTDRLQLDGQIYRNFLNVGAIQEREQVRPSSGNMLKEFLSGNKRYVFSPIQKFNHPKGKKFPLLSDRKEIIVLVDEAHRTQYKDLAENMRIAIPNAQYIAFTGTPLLGNKRLTNKFFGDYVSEYNFRQSYEDGSTVPLFYDKRVPQVQIIREGNELNAELALVAEEEELSIPQLGRLEREFGSELSIIRNPARLRKIAKDIVWHFPRRGYKGRGMVISIDRFTCIKMYELVKQYWQEEIVKLRRQKMNVRSDDEKIELDEIINYMNWVEMAVVISYDGSDDEKKWFESKGVDISPHIRKMKTLDDNSHDLEYRFQELQSDPFQLVFVSDMWLTGFDSPTLSDLYMDKPMVGHTLMQTIARVGSVSPGKVCGKIIDYYGVFRNLRKALADYATGGDEIKDKDLLFENNLPVEEKSKLFDLLHESIKEIKGFCITLNIKLDLILKCNDVFENIDLFEKFADIILTKEDYKKRFFVYSNSVESFYEASKPDIYSRKKDFPLLEVIRYLRKIVDRKKFMGDLERARLKYADIIDQSISTVDNDNEDVQKFDIVKSKEIDISKFDFEKLKEKFKKTDYKHILIEDLKLFIEDKLSKMIDQNVTRINFAEKLQEIIDQYNSGSLYIEHYHDELSKFSKQLRSEEKRHIRENLTIEELELFDLIIQENKKLTKKDKQKVKLAAKDLLSKIVKIKKELLVIDWYKHDSTRLNVESFVKNNLDENLPSSYTKPVFEKTCDVIVDHLQRLDEKGRQWTSQNYN